MSSPGHVTEHEALDCRLPARQSVPVVVASPHSGSTYPAPFLAQAAVPLASLRRAEDAFVDELFSAAPELGMPLLAARFPRSYVDANREPYELDPGMFEGPLPRPLNHRTTRVAAGLGMIPRVAASGEAIYRARVPADEIERRLEACWRPYHVTLSMLVQQTYAMFGGVLLVDAHSMPSSAAGVGPRDREHRVDIVLGDNHGEACFAELIDAAQRFLTARGLSMRTLDRDKPRVIDGVLRDGKDRCDAFGVLATMNDAPWTWDPKEGARGWMAMGVLFALGAKQTVHLIHWNFAATTAWWPWMLAGVEGFAVTGRGRHLLLAAVATGFCWLGGSPQMALFGSIAAGSHAPTAEACFTISNWSCSLLATMYSASNSPLAMSLATACITVS